MNAVCERGAIVEMSVSPAPGKLGDQFAGPELERYRELFKGARNGNASAVASLLKGGINVNVEGPRGTRPRLPPAARARPAAAHSRCASRHPRTARAAIPAAVFSLRRRLITASLRHAVFALAHPPRNCAGRRRGAHTLPPPTWRVLRPSGATPLHIAARFDQPEMVRTALDVETA